MRFEMKIVDFVILCTVLTILEGSSYEFVEIDINLVILKENIKTRNISYRLKSDILGVDSSSLATEYPAGLHGYWILGGLNQRLNV